MGLALPRSMSAGRANRPGSSGLASMRMMESSGSMPHSVNGRNSRVPTASTTSASAHNSRPSGSVTLSGIAAVENAASTPIRKDGGLQASRYLGHLGARLLRTAAHDDQRALGIRQSLGCAFRCFFINRRRAVGLRNLLWSRWFLPGPHIHGAFQRGRARPAAPHRCKSLARSGEGLQWDC